MVNWLNVMARLGQHDTATPPSQLAQEQQFMDPNRLFEMLDGRDLYISDQPWHVEVFSVSDQAQHRWVQIGLKGDHEYMLTIRLESGSGVLPVVQAVSSWLHTPSETRTEQILNVA